MGLVSKIKVARPRVVQQVVGHQVSDSDAADRMNDALVAQVNTATVSERSIIVMDLAVGANTVNHGLGAAARGCNVTPTVADATYAWSFAVSGQRQAIITVVGVAQPGATLEIYR